MDNHIVKTKFETYVTEFMTTILILQPLLDVLSYFMIQNNSTVITTTLRMLLLVVVALYGFVVSDQKKAHLILYGVIFVFWGLHIISCLQMGYQYPTLDTSIFLKLMQFPIWTLSFIAMLKKGTFAESSISGLLVTNFLIILIVIGLSYLTGTPSYTYDIPARNIQVGVMGWFGIENTQSAIVAMLVPFVLLYAFQKANLLLLSVFSFLGFGLLFMTGTRLTYYSGIVIAVVFIFLALINQTRLTLILPLVISLVLLIACKNFSPMMQMREAFEQTNIIYQEKTDKIMGEDKGFVYDKSEPIPDDVKVKIKQVYEDVYGVNSPYGKVVLGGIIKRFGIDVVMKEYNYTLAPSKLYNMRILKMNFLRMLWNEKGFLTKLVGLEYAEVDYEGMRYDPENDFQPLIYYYGYLGALLYLSFIVYFVGILIRGFIEHGRDFFSMERGTAITVFVLGLGAAQFSGQMLRNPNATFYISLAAACIYMSLLPTEVRRQSKYQKKSVVFIKKL